MFSFQSLVHLAPSTPVGPVFTCSGHVSPEVAVEGVLLVVEAGDWNQKLFCSTALSVFRRGISRNDPLNNLSASCTRWPLRTTEAFSNVDLVGANCCWAELLCRLPDTCNLSVLFVLLAKQALDISAPFRWNFHLSNAFYAFLRWPYLKPRFILTFMHHCWHIWRNPKGICWVTLPVRANSGLC